MNFLDKWKQKSQNMKSSSAEDEKENHPFCNVSFKDDLEKDFWINSLCFDCLHWTDIHRFCRWNFGGWLVSWHKCQGKAYRKAIPQHTQQQISGGRGH